MRLLASYFQKLNQSTKKTTERFSPLPFLFFLGCSQRRDAFRISKPYLPMASRTEAKISLTSVKFTRSSPVLKWSTIGPLKLLQDLIEPYLDLPVWVPNGFVTGCQFTISLGFNWHPLENLLVMMVFRGKNMGVYLQFLSFDPFIFLLG